MKHKYFTTVKICILSVQYFLLFQMKIFAIPDLWLIKFKKKDVIYTLNKFIRSFINQFFTVNRQFIVQNR